MSAALTDTDYGVRRAILGALARDAPVTRVSVMQALGLEYAEVSAAYARLAEAHVVVLDADTGEVWMALPFSAVPTDFRVVAGEVSVWANCAWDAFGVAAALDRDVSFATPCPGSGVVISAGVRHGKAHANPGAVAHVGVPAARWWDDIALT
jgi:hypothetical protein